nr:hypothetical protein [Clostridia bacterium]
AVENAILAKFGVPDIRTDTEIRWFYGLNDHANGMTSEPAVKAAPWFTVKTKCDDGNVPMLQAENVNLELDHDITEHAGKAATCTEGGWQPYETCSRCGYTTYQAIPAGHTWDEWQITQPATYAAPGQKTRECSVCHNAEQETIPMLTASVSVSDGDTGVSLSYDPSAYADDVTLQVSQIFDGDSFAVVSQAAGNFAPVLFDITTLVNGEETQPQAPVFVSIPLPEGFDPAYTRVYHVPSDGPMEAVEFTCENGTLRFAASHFSVYAVVDQTPVNTGEPSAEEPPAGEPGDQTAEQPAGSPSFFSKIIDFLNKIINIFRNLFNR